MGITNVIHHQVPVSNLEKAAQWYVDILGFELEKPIDSESKRAFLHLPNKGAAVHLIQTDSKIRLGIETASAEKDNYVIGFYCENIKELQTKLMNSGSTVILEDAGSCGWWLFFNDMDGNKYFAAEDK